MRAGKGRARGTRGPVGRSYLRRVYVMRIVWASLPSGPGAYIVKTRLSGDLYSVTVLIFEILPVMSGPSIQLVMVFVLASYVPSESMTPVDMVSTQVPTYFFLAGSQPAVPWPWKGVPII